MSKVIFTWVTMLACLAALKGNYTVKYLEGRIYVEHAGIVRLIRGNLQISISLSNDENASEIEKRS